MVATVVSGAAVVGVEVAVVDTLSDWTTAGSLEPSSATGAMVVYAVSLGCSVDSMSLGWSVDSPTRVLTCTTVLSVDAGSVAAVDAGSAAVASVATIRIG